MINYVCSHATDWQMGLTCMITNWIGIHLVLLPLVIAQVIIEILSSDRSRILSHFSIMTNAIIAVVLFQHHCYYVIIETVIMQQLYMQVTCWVPGWWEGRKKGIKWQRNDTNETFYVCEFGLLKFSGYNGINKGLVNRQQTGFIYCFKKVSCKQEVTYSLLVDVKTLQMSKS